MNLKVIFYVANIIDYFRISSLLASIFFSGKLFILLYSVSVGLDYFDGIAARSLDQVSRLGGALDMVTDRVSTMVILTKIALEKTHLAVPCVIYSVIDFMSHFLFTLASVYSGKHHKSFSNNFLMKIYYDPSFLKFICLGSELSFLATYYFKKENRFVKALQAIALLKTFFHVVHFFVAVGVISSI